MFNVSMNKVRNFFYSVTCNLIYGGKEIVVNAQYIGELDVVCDYINNFFPILHLKVYLTHKEYYEIRENIQKLLVRLRVYSVSKRVNETPNDAEDLSSVLNQSLIIDELFQPFNTDGNYYNQYTEEEVTSLRSFYKGSENDKVNSEMLELYLFNVDGLNSNKTIINAIISECSVQEAIVYVLNKTNVKNAIVSIPDNEDYFTELDEIIFPPLNFKNTIDSLQSNYGIYKIGLIQFFDFERYYLLNKDFTKELPLGRGEYETVHIIVNMHNDLAVNKDGCYVDNSSGCYVINCYDNSSITDNSEIIKEGMGSVYKVMSNESIKKSVSYDEKTDKFIFEKPYNEYKTGQATNVSSDDRTDITYNDTDNDYNEITMINNKIENTINVVMNFTNVDITLFKLNRKYAIQYMDINKSKFNGLYRIVHLGYGISQRDFYIIANFKKIVEI